MPYILVYLLYLAFSFQEELMDVYMKSSISDNGEARICVCYIKTYLLKSYVSIVALAQHYIKWSSVIKIGATCSNQL